MSNPALVNSSGNAAVYLPQKYKKSSQHGPGSMKQGSHSISGSKKGVRQAGNNSAAVLLNQSYEMTKTPLNKLKI
jgi:hypothetical protein